MDLRIPAGVIMLEKAEVQLPPTDALSFIVINKEARKDFYVTAQSERERDLWYSQIYAAIKNLDKM
jgi:hypothetical protein